MGEKTGSPGAKNTEKNSDLGKKTEGTYFTDFVGQKNRYNNQGIFCLANWQTGQEVNN